MIECMNCGWIGRDWDLSGETADGRDNGYIYCPVCDCTDFDCVGDNDG